jgi:tail assembly chaperone
VNTFAQAASRLAGLAGALFGWLPDDFWAATPAELSAILAALSDDGNQSVSAAPADLAQLMEQFPDG